MNFLKSINLINNKEDKQDELYCSIKKKNDLYDIIPMPFCIVEKGIIMYANSYFETLFPKSSGFLINHLFSNMDLMNKRQLVRYKNTNYNVNIKPLESDAEDTYILFFNESIYKGQTENIVEQQICICYIILDNYDETLEGLDDEQIPLTLAQIDKKLNEFAKSVNGVIRKYEKDRYMLVFAKEHLEYLKECNFNIQGKIKEIDADLKTSITISMGIGHSANTIALLSDYARSALELALGRGGDQVVIKNETEYEYFGQSRRESDRNSRVKARVKALALTELVLDYDNVLIMGHKNPDLDCLGASIGVYKIVRSINSSASCKIVLGDKITSSISGLYDKLILHDEYKDDILTDNKKAISMCDSTTLVIVLDVYKKELTECPELLDICTDVVVFDHHRKSSDHITGEVLLYHDSTASSTSELVTEMMIYLKYNVKLLQVESEALLAGITVDTKGFTFRTSSKTFDCASYLKKKGADSHNVHILLQNDFDVYKAKSNAVNNAKIYKDKYAFAEVTSDIENHVLVVAQTADELLNMTHITSSFVFCKLDDVVIVSLRSFGDLNVQLIAEHFGGGGHRTVSAFRASDMSIEEITLQIEKLIDNAEEEQ